MADAPMSSVHERTTPLRRLALTGFRAVSEALYPDNEFGAPSWRDTEMVPRVAKLWDALPPESRYLLEALYAGLAPVARMPVAQRFRMFDRMRKSKVWPLRFMAEAVKSSSTMVYMSHPAAMAYVGAPVECLAPPRKSAFSHLITAPVQLPGEPS